MSGSLTNELTAAFLEKQVDKIIQKPFTMDGLASTLAEVFDK